MIPTRESKRGRRSGREKKERRLQASKQVPVTESSPCLEAAEVTCCLWSTASSSSQFLKTSRIIPLITQETFFTWLSQDKKSITSFPVIWLSLLQSNRLLSELWEDWRKDPLHLMLRLKTLALDPITLLPSLKSWNWKMIQFLESIPGHFLLLQIEELLLLWLTTWTAVIIIIQILATMKTVVKFSVFEAVSLPGSMLLVQGMEGLTWKYLLSLKNNIGPDTWLKVSCIRTLIKKFTSFLFFLSFKGSRGAIKDRTGLSHPTIKLVGINAPVRVDCFIGHDKHLGLPHLFYQASRINGKNSTKCSST